MSLHLLLILAQLGTVLSVVAFFLLSRAELPDQFRRGWFIQFLAQPFWLANTWLAQQWVMFAVSVFFTVIAVNATLRYHYQLREERDRIYS